MPLFFRDLASYISEFANSGYKGPVKVNEVFGMSPSLFTLIVIIAAVAMFWLADMARRNLHDPILLANYNF